MIREEETFEMLVRLTAKPERAAPVFEMISRVAEQSRQEDGCLAFSVYGTDVIGEIWIYEQYVTRAYHDEIHEAYPEVQALLAHLPAELTGPWSEVILRSSVAE